MNANAIRMLYAYHQQRLSEIWVSVATLNDAQFLQAMPYSIGSLRNQLVHLMDDELSWLARIQKTIHQPLQPDDFITIAATQAYSEQAVTKLQTFIHSLDDAALASEFIWHPPFLDKPQRVVMWQAALHIVNHATDHRAQILRILHDLGATTFDQDFMGYLIQSGATATA